ncbi:MAG: hypothetical protein US30_C0010G0035 [Candidatus Moranbacteria bacterium GW2011_GWF2_36_839]|nr:MAG: hypothetical protein US27_C0010G0006 [Candidatus Moranbacteria bacterium GW2011_GWF1_36_78]KKQ16878.1 MAG: hypothetical protein US30_C0010G0035 [Candidatus Moranbacteria bacterium GW2011_GWF2_36_839]HAT74372.1 hypothetical protein [Candidatus Moranbacteria bacterium]HBY11124.1 hypothetical protein [Candidatus Moranbacteria bacterium]
MAHQTFYIDIDEEITSIVERLKKARASEIIIVAPKRALLIQSIVNLRILKKEADENDIQLMMVTQDKLGKILIEKAGIFVQQKMDNISDEEINLNEGEMTGAQNYPNENEINEIRESQNRLSQIGSENYFSEEEKAQYLEANMEKNRKIKVVKKDESIQEKLINKELVSGVGKISGKKGTRVSLDISARSNVAEEPEVIEKSNITKENSLDQEKKIENFFFQRGGFEDKPRKPRAEEFINYDLSKKDHKGFLIFGLISSLAVLSIIAYLFLPKATLKITAKMKTQSVDSNITGSTSVMSSDFEKEIIPAKIVSAESSIAENFKSSGDKSVSNQKSRGKITIYNEYNASPQPLVATTRFLSSNGKIFRLVNGVTIPGMETVGGETKPGTVEATVVADEAGESFNIGPDKFSIPGFEGSGAEKYTKFYAKSDTAMSGGGSGNQTANYITDGDVSEAKAKSLTKLNEEIKNKLKESAGEDVVILDDATQGDEPIYKLSNSSGDVVDTFQVTMQTKVKAIVVSKKDLNEMVAKMISKAGDGKADIDSASIKLDFGKSSVDFSAGTIDIKFHATGEIIPNLNLEGMKKEILGKNNEDLTAYLSTFSDIKDANVEYRPSFINSRIPQIESRVEIILDK